MRFVFRLSLLVLAVPLVFLGYNAVDVWQTSKRDQRSGADAIVVMGAAQYDGIPSPLFRARLDHARTLYLEEVAPLIVVLGGKQEGDRFTEAEAGAAYLERELPIDRVTGVKGGRTTLDSLQQFREMAERRDIHSIVIVSDPLHLARARAMAEDLGFEVTVSPAEIDESRQTTRNRLVRETAFLVYYRTLGRN